jgi:DNA-directed RNA polymerase specialized sigma24 family protein
MFIERLYWHIRKIVTMRENADEVLQNTFIRVYKNIANFLKKTYYIPGCIEFHTTNLCVL